MTKFLAAVVIVLCCPVAFAQLNECYKNVDQLIWVVRDIQKVENAWSRTGCLVVSERGTMKLDEGTSYQGHPASGEIRFVRANLAGARILWIQPISGTNAYSEFVAQRGDGVLALMHRISTSDALDREVGRLRTLGVQVLQKGVFPGSSARARYVLMDTYANGKYILGLIGADEAPDNRLPESCHLKLSQYAFVSGDMRSAAAYWKKLGFPDMSFTHGSLRDLQYRGQPGRFDQELGWQRHGTIVYEWIQVLKGPTVYEESLKAHGEGFHHLAFDVEDMDKAIAQWSGFGYQNVQSGAWGEHRQPGSGRFAYIDTEPIGGVIIELLWNFRE